MFMAVTPSQNAQCPLFHLLGLSTGLIKPNLKVRPSLFPGNVDGGSHIVSQDDELRRSIVVMAAKGDNVCLGHSGRKIAKNCEESKGA